MFAETSDKLFIGQGCLVCSEKKRGAVINKSTVAGARTELEKIPIGISSGDFSPRALGERVRDGEPVVARLGQPW
jgi:hypothetical protein